MKKAAILAEIFIFVIIFFSTTPLASEFWGSKNLNKYHHTDCQWAKRIKPANLVKFNSPEEAIKAGYILCKACQPPTSSKGK